MAAARNIYLDSRLIAMTYEVLDLDMWNFRLYRPTVVIDHKYKLHSVLNRHEQPISRIFGLNRREVRGGWWELHRLMLNERHNYYYYYSLIIRLLGRSSRGV
jgi:hypothetical protein